MPWPQAVQVQTCNLSTAHAWVQPCVIMYCAAPETDRLQAGARRACCHQLVLSDGVQCRHVQVPRRSAPARPPPPCSRTRRPCRRRSRRRSSTRRWPRPRPRSRGTRSRPPRSRARRSAGSSRERRGRCGPLRAPLALRQLGHQGRGPQGGQQPAPPRQALPAAPCPARAARAQLAARTGQAHACTLTLTQPRAGRAHACACARRAHPRAPRTQGQASLFSAKALLDFCGRSLAGDAGRLRQIQALMVEFKARPPRLLCLCTEQARSEVPARERHSALSMRQGMPSSFRLCLNLCKPVWLVRPMPACNFTARMQPCSYRLCAAACSWVFLGLAFDKAKCEVRTRRCIFFQ